jgi:hypothetical protein
MATHKLEEKKVATSNSTNAPKYLGSNPFLDFFHGVGFVGFVIMFPMIHMFLGVKHHVTFYDPFEMDSLMVVTCSNSHALKPCGVDEHIDPQREEVRCQMHLPQSFALEEIVPMTSRGESTLRVSHFSPKKMMYNEYYNM